MTDIILPIVERYAKVSEIIISHGKKETAFNYKSRHCRIVHREDWDLNETYGLSRRFIAAKEAANEIILQQDDDILLPEETVEQLLLRYRQQPEVIHGLFGRRINTQFHYIAVADRGDVLLALTAAAMLNRGLAEHCLGRDFEEMQSFMRRSKFKTFWNGEDIFQSLVAFKHSGLPNRSYSFPRMSISPVGNNSEAISFNPRHAAERTEFLQYAIEKMGLREQVTEFVELNDAKKKCVRPKRVTGARKYNPLRKRIARLNGKMAFWLLRSGFPFAVKRRFLTWFYNRQMYKNPD